jgi:hypothetical protein
VRSASPRRTLAWPSHWCRHLLRPCTPPRSPIPIDLLWCIRAHAEQVHSHELDEVDVVEYSLTLQAFLLALTCRRASEQLHPQELDLVESHRRAAIGAPDLGVHYVDANQHSQLTLRPRCNWCWKVCRCFRAMAS